LFQAKPVFLELDGTKRPAGAMAPSRPVRELSSTIGKEKAMNSPSDAEVIRRSLGEPEAFGLVYDRHAATVLRFLGRRVGAGVAEGLVGELFRIAFERRKTFDGSRASALPWLYGIGSNLLLKHRRGEARRLRANARMAVREAPDRRASAAALDARLLFPRVADAIEALPDGEREALLLFAWEDLSYQSVAEALELPIGTVRSRLNRARAHLRELLKPGGKNRERSR
jgi:RNA polymerase sigma-70 factor (ECF subfamily)